MRELFQNLLTGTSLRQILPNSESPYKFGGTSSDHFTATTSQESYFGGTGSDTVNYENSTGRVSVDLMTGQGRGGSAHNDTYNSIENVIGSNFGDALIGNNASNTLHGRGGNDTFVGSKGNDQLFGGEGSYDTVVYSNNDKAVDADLSAHKVNKGYGNGIDRIDGIENVVGSNFGDKLTGDEKDNVLNGLGGTDTFVGSQGDDRLIGGEGDDDTVDYSRNDQEIRANLAGSTVIKGQGNGTDTISGIENVIGSNFADRITGNYANNTLEGRGGNDVFVVSQGDDTLIGGEGDRDTVDYSSNDRAISADLALNTVTKGAGNGTDTVSGIENVVGSNFSDSLKGDEYSNILNGRGGNDAFVGSQGDDRLIGGGDVDTVDYSRNDQAISADLASNTVTKGVGNGTDTISSIENVVGSNFDDTITGNYASNTLDGGYGNDTLSGGAGNDTMTGGGGADVFEFSSPYENHGNDVITDFTVGTDTIDLSGTEVYGFEDLLNYDPNAPQSQWGNRYMVQEGENVVIYTRDGAEGDSITLENVNIEDLSANDFIFGDSLNQGVNVNVATTSVDTGDANGEDSIFGIDGVRGNRFADLMERSEASEFFIGQAGGDTLSAGAGNDTMTDAGGADVFEFSGPDANHGNDVITPDGGFGNDTLSSGAGNDTMTGGYGTDVFEFENDKSLGSEESHGNDVVTNFTVGVDKIDLSGTEVYGFEDLLNYDPSAPQSEWGDRYMVQEGENAVIHTIDGAEGDSITLEDVNMEELSANDFIF